MGFFSNLFGGGNSTEPEAEQVVSDRADGVSVSDTLAVAENSPENTEAAATSETSNVETTPEATPAEKDATPATSRAVESEPA